MYKTIGKYKIGNNNETPLRWNATKGKWMPIKINFTGKRNHKTKSGEIKSYQYKTIGYGGNNRYYLHRLVWEIFKGPIPSGLTIDHIDSDRMNNAIDNLALLTRKENSKKTALQTKMWEYNCHKVRITDIDMEFNSMVECAKYLIKNGLTRSTNVDSVRVVICKAINDSRKAYDLTIIKV